jgi:Rab5 GDP/GTP exchange factor
MGAVQFIENLDRTSITISDEEFEKNVEAAVSAIAERPQEPYSEVSNPNPPESSQTAGEQSTHRPTPSASHRRLPSPHNLNIPEKSSLSRPEVTPRNSVEVERAQPRRSLSARDGSAPDGDEDNAAVAGLLRTIQRPLSTIGRIFSDTDNPPRTSSDHPVRTPRLSPAAAALQRRGSEDVVTRQSQEQQRPKTDVAGASANLQQVQKLSAEDAAARQASAEAEEARKISRQEHKVVVDTLAGMFPMLERDVIDDVVRAKEGR